MACRYKYLHGLDGEFHNPFDHGWRHNCGETCRPERTPPAPYVMPAPTGDAALRSMEGGCCHGRSGSHHHHHGSHSSD